MCRPKLIFVFSNTTLIVTPSHSFSISHINGSRYVLLSPLGLFSPGIIPTTRIFCRLKRIFRGRFSMARYKTPIENLLKMLLWKYIVMYLFYITIWQERVWWQTVKRNSLKCSLRITWRMSPMVPVMKSSCININGDQRVRIHKFVFKWSYYK